MLFKLAMTFIIYTMSRDACTLALRTGSVEIKNPSGPTQGFIVFCITIKLYWWVEEVWALMHTSLFSLFRKSDTFEELCLEKASCLYHKGVRS